MALGLCPIDGDDPNEMGELQQWINSHGGFCDRFGWGQRRLSALEYASWVTEWLAKVGFEEYGRGFFLYDVQTRPDLVSLVQGDHAFWETSASQELSEFVADLGRTFRGGKLESQAQAGALAAALKGFADQLRAD